MRPPAPSLRILLALAAMLLLAVPAARAASAGGALPRGELIEKLPSSRTPSETCTLYLPSTWSPAKRWPVLFVFDPRGRSRFAAELFREPAERFGWILVATDGTRSGDSWEPNLRALEAFWNEPNARGLSPDPKRIYAAGFSAGAILAWVLATETPGLAGIISSGGRLPDGVPEPAKVEFAWFGAAGTTDFNWLPTRRIDRLLEGKGATRHFETFVGGHAWFPAELAADAVAWMELQAMRRGLLRRDDPFVAARLADARRALSAVDPSAPPLDGRRRLEQLLRDFDGLAPLDEERALLGRLRAGDDAKRAEKEEEREAEREERSAETITRALTRLVSGEAPMPAARLAQELGLPELDERARGTGWGATTARRIRERIFVQCAFRLPRDVMERRRWSVAETALDVAVRIHPDSAVTWYDLGCMRARSGRKDAAFEALGKAVDLGFRDAQQLARDSDLESLRDDPRWKPLVGTASAPPLKDPPAGGGAPVTPPSG